MGLNPKPSVILWYLTLFWLFEENFWTFKNLLISWTSPLRSIAQWWPASQPKRLNPVSSGILNKIHTKSYFIIKSKHHQYVSISSDLPNFGIKIHNEINTNPKKDESIHFLLLTPYKRIQNECIDLYVLYICSSFFQIFWACNVARE